MVFTVGEVLAVMLAEEHAPLSEVTRFRRIVAGSESNVAAGLVRLGHRARLATRVGADPLGDAVAAALEGWGIESFVTRSARPTGMIVRGRGTNAGTEAVHLREGAAAMELSAADVEAAWTDDVDAVFLTGITAVRSASAHVAAELAARLAREAGALVVVDPNIRLRLGSHDQYAEALAALRPVTDIAIGDLTELAALAGTATVDAVSALLDYGCRIVVTKRGADGATAVDAGGEYSVASHATRVVDTVGAGDAFAAGFIAGVLEGQPIQDSLELASRVASRVVATPGDVEGFPWRAQISSERMSTA
jgi:2-dehydro-3-deoxygluconokinase